MQCVLDGKRVLESYGEPVSYIPSHVSGKVNKSDARKYLIYHILYMQTTQ